MIGTRTSSSYTPHVDVDPADRPLILVAPRWEEAKPFLSETLSPNEEIASVFVDAILAAGGLPLQMSITEDIEVIRHYVDIADGIAIPGGPDVNPKRWGDERFTRTMRWAPWCSSVRWCLPLRDICWFW